MKTYSFIGSDKNSGKTTAFNYIYRQLYRPRRGGSLCLSSIGINGEDVDTFDGMKKPHIEILPHSCFITHTAHLKCHTGKYETLLTFERPLFSKSYIFGRSLVEMQMVLEGPNRGGEIITAKQRIANHLGDDGVFLIDGSIDRQFLASPEISDGFYFSVLFTGKSRQFERSCNFLRTITLAPCSRQLRQTIAKNIDAQTKSLLLDDKGRPIYHGETMAASDRELRRKCESLPGGHSVLYLKSALTPSLYAFLAPCLRLQLILDNFTLFFHTGDSDRQRTTFQPKVFLYNPVPVKNIFLKQEAQVDLSLLPTGLAYKNIFRDMHHEG